MRRETRDIHSGQVAAVVARGVRSLAAASGAALACLLAAFLPANPLFGQEGRAEVEEGNRLYEERRYQEARARYLEALEKAPGLAVARFNEGNALYRDGDFESSAEAYLEALDGSDPEWRSRAWYNLGNAMLERQQPDGAIEAYKEALRLAPADVDAKHNLEYALRLLRQQQRQEQDQREQDGEEGDEERNRQSRQGEGGEGDDSGSRQEERREESEDGEDRGEGEPRERDSGRPEPAEGGDEREGESPAGGEVAEMTPEQAERLLQAVTEDPDEVNRKTVRATSRRPGKAW